MMIAHELGRIENGRYIGKNLMEDHLECAWWFDQELGFWLKMIEGAPKKLAAQYRKKAQLCGIRRNNSLNWIAREFAS